MIAVDAAIRAGRQRSYTNPPRRERLRSVPPRIRGFGASNRPRRHWAAVSRACRLPEVSGVDRGAGLALDRWPVTRIGSVGTGSLNFLCSRESCGVSYLGACGSEPAHQETFQFK